MMANHSVTILTIEDDRLVRKAIASYLQGLGHLVLQAGDGAEGLEIFRRAHPDLILTDLRLPKIDGMEVLSTVQKESPDTPVIIVSGMGTLEDAIKALKLGARDYVTKPITDMALLEHAAARALERVRLIKENRRYQSFLEDEVQKKTAELQQAQKLEAIGTLAGGIAHDFNNILAAIMGFTDLALLKTEMDSELTDYLHQVQKASRRAKDLVLQILTFSRKNDTERHPIQAALTITETLKFTQATLPATVRITQHINAQQTMILADPTEIHQIITNLCTNAFHALPDEKGTITVTLDNLTITADDLHKHPQLPGGDYLQLTVSDDGCGMDLATQSAIFDPFFTTKEKGQGTGLGLSVVHGIVTDWGGTIKVKSEPGKGSTFTLLFPVTEAVARETEAVVSLPGGSERILFIDDEEDLRLLAERMLTYLGYSVICCSSAQEALKKMRGDTAGFDLVITDQSMPQMPGTELAKELLSISPGLPILLCTGYSSMVDNDKALTMGIRGFLLKPLSISKMAREIRTILDK
ncbi:MAG: response regulator [Proteobacteria bacterium]|nr:response regulator [Pseudomonadota bacterium]